MQFTDNEIATYLFCAQLPQTKTTPLTILEWNAVVKSLSGHKLQPESLLTMTSSKLFALLSHATAAQRSNIINKLEKRQKLGVSILELDEIINQGYGIMFRSQMPPKLKKLTAKYLPPFFYYAGEASLLSNKSLAIVGARDANDYELEQTAKVARDAAKSGVLIISGGAKGVDSTATETALEAGGNAVIFPADGIGKWIKKKSIRDYVKSGHLTLISSQKIQAPFTPSYAMHRNRYIHAPSDAVLVSSSKISGKKASGTWEGVLENLKYNWSPIYTIGNSEGVEQLLYKGYAKPYTSMDDLLIEKMSLTLNKNDFGLREKFEDLIKKVSNNGVTKETVEQVFNSVMDKYYQQEQQSNTSDKTSMNKMEQLSIDSLNNEGRRNQ